MISSVTKRAATFAGRAVEIIAAAGSTTIQAELEQYVEKDGVKVTLKAVATEQNVLALHRAKGCRVHIVAADVAPFVGERAPATPDPDQPKLPMKDGEKTQAPAQA